MARLLRSTGAVSGIQPQGPVAFTFEELRTYVGGAPHIVPYSSYSADELSTHVLIARARLGADTPALPFNSSASLLAGQSVYGDVIEIEVEALRRVHSELSHTEWNALCGSDPSQEGADVRGNNAFCPDSTCN